MNELKIVITDHQKAHNLTRRTLIQKTGYKNIAKGLRVFDAFIECPNNDAFKMRLCKALDISSESMDAIINKQLALINKDKIKNFIPYIRIKWTRNPSLLMTAQGAKHLYEIEVSEALLKLPIEKQFEEVCRLYKQHQLDHYAGKFNLKNSMENYTELVRIIESQVKAGIDIGWSIGNGFTYHKAFNEGYQFDRLCRQVGNIAEARWDYINDTMVPIPDGVIGY